MRILMENEIKTTNNNTIKTVAALLFLKKPTSFSLNVFWFYFERFQQNYFFLLYSYCLFLEINLSYQNLQLLVFFRIENIKPLEIAPKM